MPKDIGWNTVSSSSSSAFIVDEDDRIREKDLKELLSSKSAYGKPVKAMKPNKIADDSVSLLDIRDEDNESVFKINSDLSIFLSDKLKTDDGIMQFFQSLEDWLPRDQTSAIRQKNALIYAISALREVSKELSEKTMKLSDETTKLLAKAIEEGEYAFR